MTFGIQNAARTADLVVGNWKLETGNPRKGRGQGWERADSGQREVDGESSEAKNLLASARELVPEWGEAANWRISCAKGF